jgi:hypothetical protein
VAPPPKPAPAQVQKGVAAQSSGARCPAAVNTAAAIREGGGESVEKIRLDHLLYIYSFIMLMYRWYAGVTYQSISLRCLSLYFQPFEHHKIMYNIVCFIIKYE